MIGKRKNVTFLLGCVPIAHSFGLRTERLRFSFVYRCGYSIPVHRFVNNYTIHLPAHSDSQASEWYSYFENNVLVTNHEGMDKIVIDIAMEIAPIIADGGCLSFICDV